jgi:hypothetical protein
METKMHNDEMIEHSKGGGMEAGFGGVEDSKMMKRVVLKMDVRYAQSYLNEWIHWID